MKLLCLVRMKRSFDYIFPEFKPRTSSVKEVIETWKPPSLRNASCSSGWLRCLVQIFFGIIIVSSFTLILLMSLKSRQQRIESLSRCRFRNCRVVCVEAPYYDEFEEDIIDATWQANANCPKILLTLKRPYFSNNTLPQNWLSRIRANVNELAIIGGNLKHIPSRAFISQLSNKLQTLILEDIQITTWRPDTFAGLSSLKQLYIKDCVFKNITRNALQAVDDTLEFLDIKATFQWNPTYITGSADLERLRVVDFSLNPFHSILDQSSFSQLRMCAILRLNSCQISALAPGTFDFLERIESLCLNDNNLITVPDGLFTKIIPHKPRIALQDNQWYCNCSNTDFRDLSSKGLLILDPICRYPDEVNGHTFSDFYSSCKSQPIPELTDIERYEKDDTNKCSTNNDTKSVNIIGACYHDNNPFYKYFKLSSENTNGCYLNRLRIDEITKAKLSDKSFLQDNSWLKLTFTMRNNQLSMAELSSRKTPGQGLLWFQSSCPREVYCVNTIPDILRVFDERLKVKYTFCPFNLQSGDIDSNLCVSYSFGDIKVSFVYSNDYRMIVGFLILSLICLICGAICVYALIQRNPHLLKGNKRILLVKHKEINALILPPNVPLRKNVDNCSDTDKINKKIFFVSTHEESVSKFERSESIVSHNSNEVSYISALQPTDEQLAQWRKKQNGLKYQYKSLTSDIDKFSNLFDTNSLPYYSLNEKIYENPLEVTKK